MIAGSDLRSTRGRSSGLALLALACFLPSLAQAQSAERDLYVNLAIEATQSWKFGAQWSKTDSTQRYELATRLRTDGHVWGANLLDQNTDKRLSVKTEWLRRKGLEDLKRRNHGQVSAPKTEADKQKVQEELQVEMSKCNGDPDCMTGVVSRYSALLSAGETGPHYGYDGAALLDAQPRHYLYYQAFQGCPNRIHILQTTHAEGQKAYDKARRDLVAFKEDRHSDFTGDNADRAALCSRYNAVIDTQGPTFYLDNLYVPTPQGTTVHVEGSATQKTEGDQLLIMEAVEWASQFLSRAAPSGTTTKTIHLQWPMNGDSTVGGDFEGLAKITLTWSFLPAQAPVGAPAGH